MKILLTGADGQLGWWEVGGGVKGVGGALMHCIAAL